MKVIYTILAILLLSGVPGNLQAQKHGSAKLQSNADRGILSDTLTFTVYGMDCPGCEGGLEKQVNKIPSVQYSNADWVKQELKIVLAQDSVINMTALEKRVKKANFTLETGEKNRK